MTEKNQCQRKQNFRSWKASHLHLAQGNPFPPPSRCYGITNIWMETTIVWGSVGFSRAEWTVKANRLQTHVRPIDGTLNDLPKMAFMSGGATADPLVWRTTGQSCLKIHFAIMITSQLMMKNLRQPEYPDKSSTGNGAKDQMSSRRSNLSASLGWWLSTEENISFFSRLGFVCAPSSGSTPKRCYFVELLLQCGWDRITNNDRVLLDYRRWWGERG